MSTKFNMLAEYLLIDLKKDKVLEDIIYEFIEECYRIVHEAVTVQWTGAVEALWNYLGVSRISSKTTDVLHAFQQGQLFSAMEFVKIMQEKMGTEEMLREDAKAYASHWYRVFAELANGKSMTHSELSKAAGLSDSSLSQFMNKIKSKQYIQYRKVGRTKYYRLSDRGQRLFQLMPKKQHLDSKTAYYAEYINGGYFSVNPHLESFIGALVISGESGEDYRSFKFFKDAGWDLSKNVEYTTALTK